MPDSQQRPKFTIKEYQRRIDDVLDRHRMPVDSNVDVQRLLEYQATQGQPNEIEQLGQHDLTAYTETIQKKALEKKLSGGSA